MKLVNSIKNQFNNGVTTITDWLYSIFHSGKTFNKIVFFHNILIICLFVALFISFYFFIFGFLLRQKPYTDVYFLWQLPMIFAILCESLSIYI